MLLFQRIHHAYDQRFPSSAYVGLTLQAATHIVVAI
jgi:hypothetical protein